MALVIGVSVTGLLLGGAAVGAAAAVAAIVGARLARFLRTPPQTSS